MKRILFVMSDTGSGHRAAAQAVYDAMDQRYGGAVQSSMVDVFKNHTNFPFNAFPELYPKMMHHSQKVYDWSFRLSNTRMMARLSAAVMYQTSRRRLRLMAAQYPVDVVVSTHSIITRPVFTALTRHQRPRPLLFTVVVDLVSVHALWFDPRSHHFFLPTAAAQQAGLKSGISPDKLHMTGIPVHPKFTALQESASTLRAQLGWQDKPTVLLMGGGDGIQRVLDIALGINEARLPLQLVVVAGRNAQLYEVLQQVQWHIPVQRYAFVDNMHQLMHASDLLVTKAGSLTISEACVSGVPMLLYLALPGQEAGNVDYVVGNKVGWYTPSTPTIVRTLRQLMMEEGQTTIKQYGQNTARISHVDAVWRISDAIWQALDSTTPPHPVGLG